MLQDIAVGKDGLIAAVGRSLPATATADTEIDATGLLVIPGVVGECRMGLSLELSVRLCCIVRVRTDYTVFLCPALDTGKQYKRGSPALS
eukprot:SAG31_NODE_15095_length_771_cov_1.077381_1_plen_89_part_10